MPAQAHQLQKTISHFQQLAESKRASMLRSVEVQFIHMAQGGDGSAAYEGEIRKTYYPTWSTKDFQTVCNVMGWNYSRR